MKPGKGDAVLTIAAEAASVRWDAKKKNWITSIKVGAEVIRRSSDRPIAQDAADDVLRTWVVQTAKDEGYDLSPGKVQIER